MERQRTGISFNSLTLRVPASLSNFFRFPREQESPTPPKERWDKGQTHYKPLITGTCALGEEEIGSRAQGDTATHGPLAERRGSHAAVTVTSQGDPRAPVPNRDRHVPVRVPAVVVASTRAVLPPSSAPLLHRALGSSPRQDFPHSSEFSGDGLSSLLWS